MAEFVMPSLGADMTAGTLIQWLKKEGDAVKRGDIIAEVDTDKGVIEIEVFQDGVIEKILIKPHEEVPVGTALAIISENGAAPPLPSVTAVEKITTAPRVHISPVARKLATELGVDLTKVKGTGQGGRIQREDVELAAKASAEEVSEAPKPVSESYRFSRMRRAIAAAMSRSKREIPHYYLDTKIDMGRALGWLETENAKRPIKDHILYNVLLIKAVALALKEFPELNAIWENDALITRPKINVGVAISLRHGGLIAPALIDADKQSLEELMKNLRELVQRVRAGGLRSSELADSTITVTDLGEHGVETVFGVIYPPQVALVGFGSVYESVSVLDGRIKGCRMINATLAADHRASDGHRGSMFLSTINKLLQEPEKL